MNKKKYIPHLIIFGVVMLFVLAELFIPKPLNWKITFSETDKNPYGAYGLNKVLPGLFPGSELRNLNISLYETDTFAGSWNYLILAQDFSPTEPDIKVLMDNIERGATAFIASDHFGGLFADTLNIKTNNLLIESLAEKGLNHEDSLLISLTHPSMAGKEFAYSLSAIPNYFDSLPEKYTLLAKNQQGHPVFISRKWGKGTLYLSTTPLAFSNYYLLEGNNHEFIETALSYLPVAPLFWTEYYQLGRMEPPTPLRFILSQPSLRRAYYIGIITLLLFVLFGVKRKQRPIPTMTAPENSSLQFAHSIGTLYFQQGDHRNLARKKITFLNEHIRTHYRIIPAWQDKSFIQQLAQKSNRPEGEIEKLQARIQQVQSSPDYGADQLQRLHKSIQNFHYQKKDGELPRERSYGSNL